MIHPDTARAAAVINATARIADENGVLGQFLPEGVLLLNRGLFMLLTELSMAALDLELEG